MNDTTSITVTLPSDLEIAMSREFDASRQLLFDAYTKPEILKRWLGVRNGWVFEICEVDLRAGGKYRWVWRKNGKDLALGGTYIEVTSPERIVCTERFDEPWYPGEAIVTVTFIESRGRTTLTITTKAESKQIRDGVLQSGATKGVGESFDKLAGVLASLRS
jgi:uncharacterized protein YndB with AHSA1/START domain